ncbi:hypothetical protein SAMN05421644_1059 [Allochromatium warmingii]|uniref:Uncharacterized protein n=1 Tax=Allochromatium warmingii TaxID=61595 RepID=A0A1H3C5Y8_ALLWA|nr:hypothetical protein [Allochromatium warmingii]SDX49308.1 hypothetical protein SAMN05421644_1059 [Allochromatium warmingii]
MLNAVLALPSVALAQPTADLTAPDYAHGYERRPLPRFDAESPLNASLPERDTEPRYRFRGDPPSASGFDAPAGDAAGLRFRPLTPTERERVGPTTRWRPTDAERN